MYLHLQLVHQTLEMVDGLSENHLPLAVLHLHHLSDKFSLQQEVMPV